VAAAKSVWITLGTNSGPIPNAQRAEPSNLLHTGNQTMLVDVGDGAAWQAAKAGYDLADIQTVLISHLHFDHTGGLFALLAQRYQMGITTTLTIYGPPGTRTTVDDLVAAMLPAMGPLGVMRPLGKPPKDTVRVVEIADGSRFTIGSIKITAVQNTHFVASPQTSAGLSLAYRFDLPDRSIAYTGDTGPSTAVEELARGADLLVSEITFDRGVAVARIKRLRPGLPAAAYAKLAPHFEREHLMPPDAGLMAAHAGVKSVVFTHDPLSTEEIKRARREVVQTYRGPVTFAQDLDRF
jgi:ribonuclease BN (tRNA processing enzyme)